MLLLFTLTHRYDAVLMLLRLRAHRYNIPLKYVVATAVRYLVYILVERGSQEHPCIDAMGSRVPAARTCDVISNDSPVPRTQPPAFAIVCHILGKAFLVLSSASSQLLLLQAAAVLLFQ